MKIVNFNEDFSGFEYEEDILLDTNVIYAFLNPFDAWHTTIKELFNKHILTSNVRLYLYTHSSIVNEITYLARDPLKKYAEHYGITFTEQEIYQSVNDLLDKTKQLIEHEVLLLLESNKNSVYKQIDHSMYFGAMDSLIISLVNEYGISLLTTDTRLLNNLINKQHEFPNIANVYYTNNSYRDY